MSSSILARCALRSTRMMVARQSSSSLRCLSRSVPASVCFRSVSASSPLCQRSFSSFAPDDYEVEPQALVTRQAPNFTATAVVNGQFKKVNLSDYAGKWVVLFFYPLDFTFVCPTEIIAFSDRAKEFRSLGAELLAVSVDSAYSHLAWINTPRNEGGLGQVDIPIVADITKAISAQYGVLLPDDGVALRGLFIIDPSQKIRQATINDLPIGRSVDETLRLLQALQFVEKHGEVCPAGWKPGSDSMKADPQGAKSYWKKVHQ